jgi:hypothetical protein
MSTPFKINYNDWNEDASPISKDIKIKISHRKLVANSLISERNKDDKFRKKVSSGLKKYFGNAKERFNKTIIKQNDGCWIYPKRWIIDDNGNQLLPKNYSAILHKVKFTSGCITNTCGNKKCVNPKHLKDYPKEQQALDARNKRKVLKGDAHHQSKLTEKDIKNIKKLFAKLLKQRSGKSKGIATIIHKEYSYVSLPSIINAIKK